MSKISRRDAFRRGGAALIGGAVAMAVGEIPSAKAESYGRPTGGYARELWDAWQDAVIKAGNLENRHFCEREAVENLPGDATWGELQRRKKALPELENATIKACEDELALRNRIFAQSDTSPAMRWVKDAVGRVLARFQRTTRTASTVYDRGGRDAAYLHASLTVEHMDGAFLAGAS